MKLSLIHILIAAKDTDEFLDIIDKAENERFGEEERKTEAAAENVTEDKAVEQKVDDGAEDVYKRQLQEKETSTVSGEKACLT